MQGPSIRGKQIQLLNCWMARRILIDHSNVHFFINRGLTGKAVLAAREEIAKFLKVLTAAQRKKLRTKKSRRVFLTYSQV